MKASKLLLLSVFVSVIMLGLVSAVPPVQTTTIAQNGLEIEAVNSNYLEQNANHTFNFRVYNSSNDVYISGDNVNCSLGLVNSMGDFIFQKMDVTPTGFIFRVFVDGGNFSELGVYHKGINCLLNDGTAGGVLTQSFEITYSGFDPPEGIVIVLFSLLFILICFEMLGLLLWTLLHFLEMDIDVKDLILNMSSYFALFAFYILEVRFMRDAFIGDFSLFLIEVGAFVTVILPLIGFILSYFRQNLQTGDRN